MDVLHGIQDSEQEQTAIFLQAELHVNKPTHSRDNKRHRDNKRQSL